MNLLKFTLKIHIFPHLSCLTFGGSGRLRPWGQALPPQGEGAVAHTDTLAAEGRAVHLGTVHNAHLGTLSNVHLGPIYIGHLAAVYNVHLGVSLYRSSRGS